MKAGERDQRISLQQPAETNTDGALTIGYADVTTVWGKVVSITGRRGYEAFEAGRPNARSFISVTIPYRDDVNDKWRLVWGGQNYDVRNVDRTKRREGFVVIVAEAVGAL